MALWSQGRFQSRNGTCQGRGRGEKAAEGPGGGPTWQSIMVSSSFSSIFFSPVSAHSSASRTGPSGRPPSFFRGASQSGDRPWRGSSGAGVPGGLLKLPKLGSHAGRKRLSHIHKQQTQRFNPTYWEGCPGPGKDTARSSDPFRHTQEETPAGPLITPGHIWRDKDTL